MYAGSYRQYREGFDATAVRIQCRIGKQNGQVISADIDFIDEHNGELIARLQDYQCTMIETLTQSFANNTLN
jgi:major membrane immunogen (membrane-anchored lipoprotein)